jgi:hypothetical protein
MAIAVDLKDNEERPQLNNFFRVHLAAASKILNYSKFSAMWNI